RLDHPSVLLAITSLCRIVRVVLGYTIRRLLGGLVRGLVSGLDVTALVLLVWVHGRVRLWLLICWLIRMLVGRLVFDAVLVLGLGLLLGVLIALLGALRQRDVVLGRVVGDGGVHLSCPESDHQRTYRRAHSHNALP